MARNALPAMLAAALLPACGSASGNSDASTEAASADDFKVGINVSSIDVYSGTGPFLNLIYGSSWQMEDARGGSIQPVPPTLLDSDGWVKSLPKGYHALRALAVPSNGGKFVCRFQGNGILRISGTAVSQVSALPGTTTFALADSTSDSRTATLNYSVDPGNYLRNIDCRDASASATETFTPQFMSALSGFKTIRFMKWQSATEANWPVTWARRNKPGDADYSGNDGVPVELMIDAANRADADIWLTVPWNADDEYVRNFAALVRARLTPNHKVYVEVSNEVWNNGYPVAAQAAREARAEGLSSATGKGKGGNLERYAEKTKEVMSIWSRIFAGESGRLIRVASFQHVSPYLADLLLKYSNLSQSIDALATAPYFGYDATDSMSVDQIMAAMSNDVTNAIDLGVKQKAVAEKYGLRYLTYEAGQTVVLPKNVPLEQRVQRDPHMYDIYRLFMTSWRSQVDGQLNLFALSGQIGQYGGWGLVEYLGQPPSKAPKMRAVQDFLEAEKSPPRR